jgi:hypothetical protein
LADTAVLDGRTVRVFATGVAEWEDESRVMIDPSLALTDEGMALFEDEATARGLAVSQAFYEALADEDRRQDFEAFGVVPDVDQMRRLRGLLEPRWVEKFSYENLEGVPDSAVEIHDALLEDGEALAAIAAEQWVFMVSRSWLLDRSKRFLERIRRAGARAFEWTAEEMRRLIDITGSAAKVIAEAAKFAGHGVEIAIEVAGPAIAALLLAHGLPVSREKLDAIGQGVGVLVELDP